MSEARFIELNDGFIHVDSVQLAEKDSGRLIVLVKTKPSPIVLSDPADIAMMTSWLKSHSWRPDEQPVSD